MLLCRWAQTTAAVLLTGTAALRLLAHGAGLGELRGWRRLAGGSWGALLVAGALQLWLTAAAMSGLPPAQALSGEVLGQVLNGTSFGVVWRVRMCLLAALPVVQVGLALRASPFVSGKRRPAGTVIQRSQDWLGEPALPGLDACGGMVSGVLAALLAAAVLASLVWSGHARASAQNAWLLPVDVAHALAAGAWPGGLAPLLVLLARARRHPGELSAAVTVTRRFSRLSVVAVGILALSGVLNGVGLVGTPAALWTSVYGRLVLCKAALFAVMVCLGAANRRRLGHAADADPAGTIRLLWRTVAWECALAAGVLLATELLAAQPPPV